MTSRTYRTAQGKIVDLGQLILQNENVRAVGNMNVNARGDRLDSSNQVVDSKNQQLQRQHQRQITSNVIDNPVHTSNVSARKSKKVAENPMLTPVDSTPVDSTPVDSTPVDVAPPIDNITTTPKGGLAAAIARSRTVVQEKEKTSRELKQSTPGVNRI